MTGTVIVDVLVGAGVLVLLMCAAGLLLMRSAYDRLHYASGAGWGALLIGIAILARESWSLIGDKALAVGFVLVVCGSALGHATARAGRVRQQGTWNGRQRR